MLKGINHMRLFIGIGLDQNVKNELINLQDAWLVHASKYHKTTFDNIHLTLKFLGEVNASKIDEIMIALDHNLSTIKTFDIQIEGIGSFIHDNEHILWAGITKGKENLQVLYNKVEDAIKSISLITNQNKFRPHITLARRVFFDYKEIPPLPLISARQKITTITLFHSHQVEGRLTYTPIGHITLR